MVTGSLTWPWRRPKASWRPFLRIGRSRLLYGGYNTVEAMTTADFNKDGRDDLILASSDGKLRWLRAKPNGAFDVARVQTVPRDFVITDIEAGDFDRDGWLDVVYTDAFHIYELISDP